MMQILRGPRHKASKRILFRVSRLTSCKKPAYRATRTGVASQSWRYKPKSANSTNRLDQSKQQRPPDQLRASVYRKGAFFRQCSIYPTYQGAEEDWKTSEEVAGTRTRIHLSCSNDGQPYNRGIGHIRASFYGPQILIKPRHNIVVSRLRSALNGDCNPRRGE